MAIYELRDLLEPITETKKETLPQYVINTSNVLTGSILPVLEEKKVLGQFKKIARINDILFSEIRPGNGRWALVKEDITNCLISTKLLVLRTNHIIIPEYAFYILTNVLINDIVQIAESRSGTFPQITFSNISHLKINLPSLKQQQEIIDIIKPIEDMIDLIDSILKIQNQMFTLQETNSHIKDYITKINTGYAYKKEDKINNGNYKIYTIKNISGISKYENTNFIKNNVLKIGDVITGLSGTIGTASPIFTNGLVSNQRTLGLSTDYPVQIANAIELQKKELYNISTGAVQKNITAINVLDLKFKPFFNNSFDNNILLLKRKKTNLINIKEKTIKLLIK
ncbi:MAG: restriction endonuclease subunit S [Mycoplasmatales bacterium]